ncbi:hypothetical protein ACHAWX_000200 [Stephanocyclus meneghinianus]
MPAGFGVGDHRMFVVDFRTASLVGAVPPKIIWAPSRQLNTKIPWIADEYNQILESILISHQMNWRLLETSDQSKTVKQARKRLNLMRKVLSTKEVLKRSTVKSNRARYHSHQNPWSGYTDDRFITPC